MPVGDESTRQAFPLSVTASFIYLNNQKLSGYTPPPPPVLFKIPYDVFYPFNIGNPSPKSYEKSITLAILSIIGSIFVIQKLI